MAGRDAHLHVEPLNEGRGLQSFVRQGAQHREQQGHEQGRRAALARHVTEGDEQAAMGNGNTS